MYVASLFQRICFTNGDQYPSFTAAFNSYQQAEAGYMAAFANLDGPGQREWQQKRQQKFAPLLAKGGDESQFIIYTGEE